MSDKFTFFEAFIDLYIQFTRRGNFLVDQKYAKNRYGYDYGEWKKFCECVNKYKGKEYRKSKTKNYFASDNMDRMLSTYQSEVAVLFEGIDE